MSGIDSFRWVETDQALAELCQHCPAEHFVAMDTEFIRTDTYFAKLGLIQIATATGVSLIDPLTISDWQPFVALLENVAVTKVFHSLSEDIDLLRNDFGVEVQSVFDTQIAAGFLGFPVQCGYSRLVSELFDVALDDSVTRSDWLKRPLAQNQCVYAAEDVQWLYRIYQQFQPALEDAERLTWVQEDSQQAAAATQPVPPEHYYLKLRGAWKLKGKRLKALQLLCCWRENEARQVNVNRSRILSDKELIAVAEKLPSSKASLQKLLDLPPRKIRLYAEPVLSQISLASESVELAALISPPLPADKSTHFKALRQLVRTIAEDENIPEELLAKRKLLERWYRAAEEQGATRANEEIFTGWRGQFLKQPLENWWYNLADEVASHAS